MSKDLVEVKSVREKREESCEWPLLKAIDLLSIAHALVVVTILEDGEVVIHTSRLKTSELALAALALQDEARDRMVSIGETH